jgi:hypothetical protein
MYRVPQARLTLPAVAGQLERGVRQSPTRSEKTERPLEAVARSGAAETAQTFGGPKLGQREGFSEGLDADPTGRTANG